jgi:pilus assembly protein Flp/PilA
MAGDDKCSIMNAIKNFINDEAGITAIEYALMAAAIAAAITAGLAVLGPKITDSLKYISGLIKSA